MLLVDVVVVLVVDMDESALDVGEACSFVNSGSSSL